MIDPITNISQELAENPTVASGAECIGCRRILPWGFFKKDHSYSTGRVPLCDICASVPKLSTVEHTARLRERTLSSEDVARQRQDHQEELYGEEAKWGRSMASSDFLSVLKKLIPNLYAMDGNIAGDISLFRTYGSPQPDLDGRTFRYIGFMPTGELPEYSIWEFDTVRDIAIREKQRGWRTVLLMLIRSEVLTEDVCNKVFGVPTGPASSRWHRTLHGWRNL